MNLSVFRLMIALSLLGFSERPSFAQETLSLAGQMPDNGEKIEVLIGANLSLGGESKNKIYPGSVQRYFWVDVSALVGPTRGDVPEVSIRVAPQYIGTRLERDGTVLSEKGMMSSPISVERHVDLGVKAKLAIYYVGANFEFRDVESEIFFAQTVISALGAQWMYLDSHSSYLGISVADAFFEGGVELSRILSLPFEARMIGGIRQEISMGDLVGKGLALENRAEFYGRLEVELSERYEAWAAAGVEIQSFSRGKNAFRSEKFVRAGISVRIR